MNQSKKNDNTGDSGSEIERKIRTFDIFKDLPDSEISALARHASWNTYAQGQKIIELGQPAKNVLLIGYGAAKLIRLLPTGEEVTMHFVTRGQIIGAVVAMQKGGRYPLSAYALEDSGVLSITGEYFTELMNQHPILGPRLVQQMSLRIHDLHADKASAKRTVSQRVAEFLLRKMREQPAGYGTRISIRLTRQDIANTVGSTVESVIRVLSQWTQQDWIITEDHRIEIKNPEALEKILNDET